MNNTVIFQHKYVKYKNKYQILKNKIIQKGSGNPPFQCLVFNQRSPSGDLQMFGFYEIGRYDAGNYNKTKSDYPTDIFLEPLEIWNNLENELTKIKTLKAATFEDLSILLTYLTNPYLQNHMTPEKCKLLIDKICDILYKCILKDGIVLIESNKLYKEYKANDYLNYFHRTLQARKFTIIGTIGIKSPEKMVVYYTLYSKNANTKIISNMEDINTSESSMMPFIYEIRSDSENPLSKNNHFKYIKESNHLEFIMKRILSSNIQEQNEQTSTSKYICIPNKEGNFNSIIACKTACKTT